MNEVVNTIDQIRSTVDPSAVLLLNGVNGTPLADQLKFSSLLKTFVETPQEALAAVQGNKKTFDKTVTDRRFDDFGQNRELRQGAIKDGARSSENTNATDTPRNISKGDKPKVASVTRDALREGSSHFSEPNQVKQPSNQSGPLSVDPKINNSDIMALVKNPIAGPVENLRKGANNTDKALSERFTPNVMGKSDGTRGLNLQNNMETAANTGSSANINKEFTNLSELLNTAVTKKLNKGSARGNTASATETLANRQAQDLAQRLGQGSQAQIQVALSDTGGKQSSTPSQALTNGALLATLGSSGESDNNLGNSLQRSGANVLTDRQAPNSHFGAQNNGASYNSQQDTAAVNFAQAIRAQAQALSGQQTANAATLAPKFAPITADAASISNINGPNSLSQLSQSAKANPSAARQPHTPPAPMEQVSVQIQRAVLSGSDKINIKLHPAHLGRVEVRLNIAADGQLSAIIMAEKPETLELLQRDIKGLEKALQQAGLDTNSNSFNFGLKQNSAQKGDLDRGPNNGHDDNSSELTDIQGDEIDPGILMKQHEYGHNSSTNGGIDIQV
jgi:flagellar hook-length control protein FliK